MADDTTCVQLEHGNTNYQLTGPGDGVPVVLIHGLTIPMFCWDGQVEVLSGSGFRVLRYDQYGRGGSDAPDVRYDRSLYREQLRQLLEALGIDGPVGLVGHSFGGAVAAEFTAAYPERVGRIVFFSPYLASPGHRLAMFLLRIPMIGEYLMRNRILPMARRRGEKLLSGFRQDGNLDEVGVAGDIEEYARRFFDQLDDPGFYRRFLSMFRSDAVAPYHDRFRSVAESGIPTMLLWGDRDEDVPKKRIEEVRGILPQADFRVFHGVGHSPYLERRDECNRMLIEFLTS
jgi:pimeloyl-ACP methyl ester carboxylesterase